jgi:hypothetical protein
MQPKEILKLRRVLIELTCPLVQRTKRGYLTEFFSYRSSFNGIFQTHFLTRSDFGEK